MKHLLLTTIAAVVLVGCGPSVDIHEAARDGNIEVVKQYLDAGADVNAKGGSMLYGTLRNPVESTALHTATGMGHEEIAELLIANGADVNAMDDNGDTPLDYATAANRTETADLLRKHGGKTSEELKAESK